VPSEAESQASPAASAGIPGGSQVAGHQGVRLYMRKAVRAKSACTSTSA